MQAKKKLIQHTYCVIFLAAAIIARAEGPVPIKPLAKDGHPLNTDFETGTLQDWTATGDAFKHQPVRGDTVAKRQPGLRSGHHGEYWIGTYETGGDIPQGTLTSAPFKVTHPFASFLVAGGPSAKTRVELVDAKTGEVFFKISGNNDQELRPVIVHLQARMGMEMFIRIVDNDSGGWGYISFDDFEFYDDKPNFRGALDSEELARAEQGFVADHVEYSGLTPQDAASCMTLPPGFKATLVAGEPDVKQPLAMAIDDRGRLWVAENYTYPVREAEGKGKDRILVFEDTKGNGTFDKRTVFMEGLNLASGLAVGYGGVWVGAAPYFMYIPIKDGPEPKPGGPRQILLDGFSYEDTHHVLNTFTWGPDGWLYGCQGTFNHSKIGKPNTPDRERVVFNGGIWRYHPTKHIFESFAEGTSNPWGIDFDEHGQCFAEACVIPHMFHMIEGGRFTRMNGTDLDPYTYDDISTVADHLHYIDNPSVSGVQLPWGANGRSAALGGGHAHAGLIVYQGDNWPPEYLGRLYMNNLHGVCINTDVPERKGSGFVVHHAPNLLNFNDTYSEVIHLETGPDGGVYMIDWYDKTKCYDVNPGATDRSNGRIFKISYVDPAAPKVKLPKDLAKLSDKQLLQYQVQYGTGPAKDNWLARHARRILQERASAGQLKINLAKELAKLRKSKYCGEDQNLHLLWAEQVTTGLSETVARRDLKSPQEYIRAWTIQFLCENKTVSPAVLADFTRMAADDKSPVVRLYLASALQRLPLDDRWEIVKGLCSHREDTNDHNLPLMVWYGAGPLAAKNPDRALKIAESASFTNFLGYTVRRVAALDTPEAFAAIVQSLNRADNDAKRLTILRGFSAALNGQRTARMPPGWDEVKTRAAAASSNREVHNQLRALSLTFGSITAQADFRDTLADSSASPVARREALEALLGAKDKGLAPIMQNLLDDPGLQQTALRGLAAYDDAKTPEIILAHYNSFQPREKHDAVDTLTARASFARALLAAIAAGTVPRTDISADIVRNMRNLHNADLDKELAKYWTVAGDSSAEKKALIEKYKKIYRARQVDVGMASRGRFVFSRTCQQCHTLFDTGGKVGPELTGSHRADLDYILENIVDPNLIIPNDYKAWILETEDDRTITGIVKQQDGKSVTVVTPTETLTIPRKEIRSLKQSKVSMMPEGLLENLKDQEVTDLIYYLSQPGQVPMPGTASQTLNPPRPRGVRETSQRRPRGRIMPPMAGIPGKPPMPPLPPLPSQASPPTEQPPLLPLPPLPGQSP